MTHVLLSEVFKGRGDCLPVMILEDRTKTGRRVVRIRLGERVISLACYRKAQSQIRNSLKAGGVW